MLDKQCLICHPHEIKIYIIIIIARTGKSLPEASFPTGTVDPRVGISRFHCTPMIDSFSHIYLIKT